MITHKLPKYKVGQEVCLIFPMLDDNENEVNGIYIGEVKSSFIYKYYNKLNFVNFDNYRGWVYIIEIKKANCDKENIPFMDVFPEYKIKELYLSKVVDNTIK